MTDKEYGEFMIKCTKLVGQKQKRKEIIDVIVDEDKMIESEE